MLKSSDLDISVITSNKLKIIQKNCRYHMRVTVKEGWSEKSKLAIMAIIGSLIAIIAVIILD